MRVSAWSLMETQGSARGLVDTCENSRMREDKVEGLGARRSVWKSVELLGSLWKGFDGREFYGNWFRCCEMCQSARLHVGARGNAWKILEARRGFRETLETRSHSWI